ncbi:Uncharacterized protein CLAVI_000173 [Candidatus Clavichlamydia salmonicola]|uniref:hypothetical protein n=1 Tax=Candidatus Clavichlamydia salmonicola TaxID=469812 RepID=UPI001891E360|nr:hypothetical protein [Candidatus Clavichlamydia salmonicola]MBF5050562.1 Uncharacterized protein [Candidatus Clavichlamydia salmonicola]
MLEQQLGILQSLINCDEHPSSLWKHLPSFFTVNASMRYPPFNRKILLYNIRWLTHIHYSWLLPIFQKIPANVKGLFFSLLPNKLREALQNHFDLHGPIPHPCSEFAAFFLLDFLKKQIVPEHVIDTSLLPSSDFKNLLRLNSGERNSLADLLGMYDVAIELQQVVDCRLIAKLDAILSQKQKQFLEYCKRQPVKWMPPPLHVIDTTCPEPILLKKIHRRGLLRLACAIKKENTSFIWHLLRRFDYGRAQIIEECLHETPSDDLLTYFKSQVLYCTKVLLK